MILTASAIEALLIDKPLMVSVVEAVIVPPLTIEPLLVILKTLVGVAELEATRISWFPFSHKETKALPVTAPSTSSLCSVVVSPMETLLVAVSR